MAMLPGRWDPWSDLASLHNTMDRLFGNVFGSPAEQGDQGRRARLSMPVNVAEHDTGYEIQAPVPGFRPEEIEVTFADGLLTIRAEHEQEEQSQQGQTLRREFLRADSVRQLGLSGEIDPDKIEASVENGMLTVKVPKAAAAQPRRIPIASTGARTQLTGSSS